MLDLRADDYVETLFGIGELLGRRRTALRHVAAAAHEMIRILVSNLLDSF